MDRNYLKGRDGDRANAVLAAAVYNFGLLPRWLAELLRALSMAFARQRAGRTVTDREQRQDRQPGRR